MQNLFAVPSQEADKTKAPYLMHKDDNEVLNQRTILFFGLFYVIILLKKRNLDLR